MPKVTFLPMNTTVEAKDGESILDVAIQYEVPLQHACGGFCACTTCHVKVTPGMGQALSEMEEEETDRLERVSGWSEHSRLGCQARVHGDVTVEIMNLD